MITVMLLPLRIFFPACAVFGMTSLAFLHAVRADDGTIIRDLSPDKRYEVRKSGNEKDTIEIADLRERKGDKLILNFAELYGLKGKAEDTTTM